MQSTSATLHLVQGHVTALAEFLGEKKDSDPAAMFSLLHTFAKAFDATLVGVAKRMKPLADNEGRVQEDPQTPS